MRVLQYPPLAAAAVERINKAFGRFPKALLASHTKSFDVCRRIFLGYVLHLPAPAPPRQPTRLRFRTFFSHLPLFVFRIESSPDCCYTHSMPPCDPFHGRRADFFDDMFRSAAPADDPHLPFSTPP